MIYPISRWMDIKGDIPPKTIYLSWDIYDLRSTIAYDTPLSHKVYLTENSASELKVEDTAMISLNKNENFFINDSMLFCFRFRILFIFSFFLKKLNA